MKTKPQSDGTLVKNYALEIARLQLERVALKFGAMCADPHKTSFDSSLEIALHNCARAFYAAAKSTEEETP
jgi:hypothetical protein